MSALVNVVIPGIRIRNPLNNRSDWRTVWRRGKAEKAAVLSTLVLVSAPTGARLVVTLTRIGPGTMDTDNLGAAFKHVRDGVAKALGRDDGAKAGIEWRYSQERGRPREYAVRIRIAHADEVTP